MHRKQFRILLFLTCPLFSGEPGEKIVPAGARLEVRLQSGIRSYSSEPGQPVLAQVIAPAVVDGEVLIPPGSTMRGVLTEVRPVGWGFRPHATVALRFDSIEFPDGTTRPVTTQLVGVDNARERVDAKGRIIGIRATSAMGFRLAGITRNIFIWDPLIQGVLALTTTATLRFPEAEIDFQPGTELTVAVTSPFPVEKDWPWSLPHVAAWPRDNQRLRSMVRAATWRALTSKSRKPADVVNVILLGEPEWIDRAFRAAGWEDADPLTKSTGWKTFRAVAENGPYPKAPMSGMLLDEQPARFQFSKSLNTYSKRHHLRIWEQAETWNGRPVHAAASTQDVAITFSFSLRRPIHVIDRNIDNERAKVVNDLVHTGCVDAAELMDRRWVPGELTGSNGGQMITDGAVAILELNPCRRPVFAESHAPSGAARPGIWKRVPRNILLTAGNDFTFNNPVVQAVKGVQFLWRRAARKETWPTFRRQTFIARSVSEAPEGPEVTPD